MSQNVRQRNAIFTAVSGHRVFNRHDIVVAITPQRVLPAFEIGYGNMEFIDRRIWSLAGPTTFLGATATEQGLDATVDALAGRQSVPVSIDNFARGATDIELDNYVAFGGGATQSFFTFLSRWTWTSSPPIFKLF